MRVNSIHEIYLQIKSFQTIGFHHQGVYSIGVKVYQIARSGKQKLGFPVCDIRQQKQFMMQYTSDGVIDQDKCTFNSKSFEVRFNQQVFRFQSSCIFKIQIDQQNDENPQIIIQFSLIKYPPKAKEDNNMESHDNIMKTEMGESFSPKNNSYIYKDAQTNTDYKANSKSKQKENQSKSKENPSKKKAKQKKGQNEPKSVNKCKLKINCSQNVKQNVHSNFRKMMFPNQEYFSTFFICVSHVNLGYSIRSSAIGLHQFYKDIKNPDSPRKSIKQSKSNKQIKQSKHNKQKTKNISPKDFTIKTLKSWQPQITNLYDCLISEQIQRINKLMKYSKYLQQYNPSSRNRLQAIINPQRNRIPDHLFIGNKQIEQKHENMSVADQKQSIQELFDCYQVDNIDELYYTIYLQSIALQMHTLNQWYIFVSLISSKKIQLILPREAMLCFHQEIQSLTDKYEKKSLKNHEKNHKSYYSLSTIKPMEVPHLKYCHDLYQRMPRMQIIEKKPLNFNSINLQEMDEIETTNTLFILVHGLDGAQHDMNTIKSHISSFYMTNILTIRSLHKQFNQTIEALGKQTAQEIKQYLSNKYYIKKLNFIGFSLGGLIIRAAIQHLEGYWDCFNMLITLSTPHLGIYEVDSCLVRTYTSIMNRFSKKSVFKQLSLDSKIIKNNNEKDDNKNQCYLEKLAEDDSIRNFKFAVFVGASQDLYVPLYSSTLKYEGSNQKILNTQTKLRDRLQNCQLVNVCFDKKDKGTFLDRILHRKIHTNFLGDNSFLHYFFSQYYLIL